MESGTFLILLGGLLVLAFLAEEAFGRLRLPPVLVLIGCGLLLGPGVKLLPPERFAEVAPHFGALAFLLILFEGGLDLELHQVLGRWRAGLFLALASFAVALAAVTLVAVAFGMPPGQSLVLGVVLAPISGAIVIPLAGKLGLDEKVRTLMVLEAALADVLGVLGIVLAGQLIKGGGLAGLLALGSLLAALFSVLLAAGLGLLWPRVLRWLGDRRFVDVLTFGVAMVLYGVVEQPGASGALAVLVFGLTLSNEQPLLHMLHLREAPVVGVTRRAVHRLHGFIGELDLPRAGVLLRLPGGGGTLRPPAASALPPGADDLRGLHPRPVAGAQGPAAGRASNHRRARPAGSCCSCSPAAWSAPCSPSRRPTSGLIRTGSSSAWPRFSSWRRTSSSWSERERGAVTLPTRR